MSWTETDIELAIALIKENKNFKEIGEILNKTQNSVTKKLNKLGYKSVYNKTKTKYDKIDWVKIQKLHDDGYSYRDLIIECKLTPIAIKWGKDNGKLLFRNQKEGLKLAWKKGKYKESDKTGLNRYRQLCEFKFNVFHFPNKFDLKLIEEFGWYKAKNRGDNPNGVSRDHMYSVKEGYLNNIDPYIISHPANCMLMKHNDNNKKNINCSISLEELNNKINKW
ncbi:hypothetical protein CCP3SC1AL1_1830007 [Gammaproteobacteria bacterium]